MQSIPAVSILMTSFNRADFIEEAIESVINCGYEDWELIISDDTSSDGTFEIARRYLKYNKRIKVFKNERNLGDYGNRNKAASYARGEYLVIVDSDDWMLKGVLEKWVSIMNEKNADFGIFGYSKYNEPVLLTSEEIIQIHFFDKPVLSFGPIATIIRNSFFKKVNGFPEKYGPANDMYYNLKAASQTNTMLFPYPLVNYRIHDGQEFHNKYSYLYNNYRYLRDAMNELNLPLSETDKTYLHNKNKRRFLTNVTRYFIKTRDWRKTKYAINEAGYELKDALKGLFH